MNFTGDEKTISGGNAVVGDHGAFESAIVTGDLEIKGSLTCDETAVVQQSLVVRGDATLNNTYIYDNNTSAFAVYPNSGGIATFSVSTSEGETTTRGNAHVTGQVLCQGIDSTAPIATTTLTASGLITSNGITSTGRVKSREVSLVDTSTNNGHILFTNGNNGNNTYLAKITDDVWQHNILTVDYTTSGITSSYPITTPALTATNGITSTAPIATTTLTASGLITGHGITSTAPIETTNLTASGTITSTSLFTNSITKTNGDHITVNGDIVFEGNATFNNAIGHSDLIEHIDTYEIKFGGDFPTTGYVTAHRQGRITTLTFDASSYKVSLGDADYKESTNVVLTDARYRPQGVGFYDDTWQPIIVDLYNHTDFYINSSIVRFYVRPNGHMRIYFHLDRTHSSLVVGSSMKWSRFSISYLSN